MHGEYSRLSFDRRKHISALLQQQGRVGLDSDWNEWVEVVLRRLAIETIDVIGACGRPKHAPGFAITAPGGAVMIGAGRLYAGGMLAELETEIAFLEQYDWPIPQEATWAALFPGGDPWPGLDFSQLGADPRVDLFYVEVWQRHLTAVNDEAARDQILADTGNNPDWDARPTVGDQMRERALGGPDTCARLQTVAQVKYLTITEPGVTTCERACELLAAERPPTSSGRMQVHVEPTAPVTSPCTTSQTGGYGGVENRTYRVEIHDPGAEDEATFKWSTENGAFMVRVEAEALTSVAANADLTLLSIGNDQATQLAQDDWVELCGEETELGMFRNPVVQIVANPIELADGKWRVQLTDAVVVPRAPFLRRWSGPVQTVAMATPFALDAGSGLTVEFSDAAGAAGPAFFHDRDCWIWSARTLTRGVEPEMLTKEPQPPRGIERAYCCLALVTWEGEPDPDGGTRAVATSIVECDEPFPPLTELPEGGCSLCTICVGDGIVSHGELNGYEGLLQARDRVLAEGGGTICLLRGDFQLEDTVVFAGCRNLLIYGCGRGTVLHCDRTMALRFEACKGVELRDFSVAALDPVPQQPVDGIVAFAPVPVAAGRVEGCSGIVVERLRISVDTDEVFVETTCACIAIDQAATTTDVSDGVATVRDCELLVRGNGRLGGIALQRTAVARIEGNVVGVTAIEGAYAIDLEENCDACVVERNILISTPAFGDRDAPRGGVHVGSGCDHVVVRANRIAGGLHGIALGSVSHNGASAGGLRELRIEGNDVLQTGLSGIGVLEFAVHAAAEMPVTDDLLISGNTVVGCAYTEAPWAEIGGLRFRLGAALALATGEGIRVVDNDIRDNGHSDLGVAPHPVGGVLAIAPASSLMLSRNRIVENFSEAEKDPIPEIVSSNAAIHVPQAVPGKEAFAAVTISNNELVAPKGPALRLSASVEAPIVASDNHMVGAGFEPAVLMHTEGAIRCIDNQIESRCRPGPAIHLRGRHATFSTNHCISRFVVDHVLIQARDSAIAQGNHCLEPQTNGAASLVIDCKPGIAVANVTTNVLIVSPPSPATTLANVLGVTI